MDDRELERMFQGAAGEPPEPTFGPADIAKASRRATVKRRNAITVACGCAVVLVAGIGVTGVVLNSGDSSGDASVAAANSPRKSAGAELATPDGQPEDGPARPPNAATPKDFPASPKQGGEASGENGPRAGTSGCDKVDRELATALAGELPVTVSGEAMPGRLCPTDSKSAGFPVRAGDRAGDFSVAVVEPGSVTVPDIDGAVSEQVPTARGRMIVVLSVPAADSPGAPLVGDVQRIAASLADRY